MSLAAVNQIYDIHEAMTGCKNVDSLKACFENVNITPLKIVSEYDHLVPKT